MKQSTCVVIGSPPATGKTSLLQLLHKSLQASKQKVHFFRVPDSTDSINDLLTQLNREVGFDLSSVSARTEQSGQPVWLLIDDAQNAYTDHLSGIWPILLKTVTPMGDQIRFVIATTYDVTTQGSPVSFVGRPHLRPPPLTFEEAEQLFSHWSLGKPWVAWKAFFRTLWNISGGHVGVLLAGIRMLWVNHIATPKTTFFDENDGIAHLLSAQFFQHLNRCFPTEEHLESAEEGAVEKVLEVIAKAETADAKAETSLESPGTTVQFHKRKRSPQKKNDPVAQSPLEKLLRRGGVLTEEGGFSSVAAKWYYYNRLFPNRALHLPPR